MYEYGLRFEIKFFGLIVFLKLLGILLKYQKAELEHIWSIFKEDD